jgi:predicted phosphodiesterase
MKPYLQAVSGNRIFIMVECDNMAPVYVQFYDSLNKKQRTTFTGYALTTEKTIQTFVHRVVLDTLIPGMKYYYRITQGDQVYDGGYFRAAALPGDNFRFALFGDCRSDPDMHSLISVEIKKHEPSFSIYLGDLAFNNTYNMWKKEFFTDKELDLSTNVPFFNAIGNHEGWYQNTKAFLQAPYSASEHNDYYSFDYGDIHFLILNTMTSCKKGSPQYDFVKKDLQSTKKKWKIAAFHHPAYCGGEHGDNQMMVAVTKEIFEPNKVDLVLAGHNHFYQRNLVNGIYHLVVAGGGAPLYDPSTASYTQVCVKDYNYGIVDFTPNLMKINIYNVHGQVLDSFEIKK